MKNLFIGVCLAFTVAVAFAAPPKYVFLYIGDGMSTPQRMVAEEFARNANHGELAMNMLPYHATTRTRSLTSLITDSAAAATAIACGSKTYNGALGVDGDNNRVESVAEVAHRNGQKVGIVTTVTICHATPAGFYAHRKNRGLYYQIGLDLIASGFEYFAGGGLDGAFDKKKDPEYRGNVYELAAQVGYKMVWDKPGFTALKPGDGKVWVHCCEGELPYDIDTDFSVYPSLAELTQKGIELLDNPNGFFMMIEGGTLDHSGHSNDAAANLRDVLALDKAVQVGLAFAKAHADETLLIVTGDHETGGMAMGFAGTGYAFHMDRLVHQKCSSDEFARILRKAKKEKPDFSFEDAKPLLTKYFGFVFEAKEGGTDDKAAGEKFAKANAGTKGNPMLLRPNEIEQLKAGFNKGSLHHAARKLISDKSGVGWSSGSHTALPVLTTSTGKYADHFIGMYENTEIANRIKQLYQ